MKKYTHDEWLRGPFFNLSNPRILNVGNHPLDERDIDELNENDPLNLWQQGYITDVELEKIQNTQKEVFKKVVQFYKDQIPSFIETLIQQNIDDHFVLKEKLDSINQHFSKQSHKKDLKWIISDMYPSLNVPGTICNEIIQNETIEPYLKWFYNSQIDHEIPSVLPYTINSCYPHHFLLNSVLFEERRVIVQKISQSKLSPELIIETYIEKKHNMKASDAFENVYSWLTDKNSLTEEQVKSEYGITLTADALKQRAYRFTKSKKSKK